VVQGFRFFRLRRAFRCADLQQSQQLAEPFDHRIHAETRDV